MQAYGGKCICCGIAYLEFLELHHPDMPGKEHRELLTGNSKASGYTFYRALKNAGYPQTPLLQVMCANCHAAITQSGSCPHQTGEWDFVKRLRQEGDALKKVGR